MEEMGSLLLFPDHRVSLPLPTTMSLPVILPCGFASGHPSQSVPSPPLGDMDQ